MMVVEVLPFGQALPKIHVVGVAEELVELLLIRAVRALDLAVELRGAGLDVDVSDALIGEVPVEQCLELMPAIRPHGVLPVRTACSRTCFFRRICCAVLDTVFLLLGRPEVSNKDRHVYSARHTIRQVVDNPRTWCRRIDKGALGWSALIASVHVEAASPSRGLHLAAVR